jgi:hypothetical protein
MSSKKYSLKDQARELAEEIEIPMTVLPSRSVPEEPEQGREVVEEAEVAVVTEAEPEPIHAEEPLPSPAAKPTIVKRRSAQTPARVEDAGDSLDQLAREGPELAPLSCRVPKKVRQVLDQRVHELKARGKKIKMEDVVTAALVSFLKIED